ncbi:MAG TPA: DUF3320 domain-containing protein, partial [Planctomycetota bacterium]|nr:DUF3320 domain-containing protein [Planctomycetota bacterium]
ADAALRKAAADLAAQWSADASRLFDGDPAARPFRALADATTTWIARRSELRPWSVFAESEARARACGAGVAADRLRRGDAVPATVRAAFERAFLEAWLDQAFDAHAEFRGFVGAAVDRDAGKFREADRAWIAAGGAAVAVSAAAARPRLDAAVAAASEAGLVLAEARKKRRHLPVRRLFERIPNLLPRLKPCLLMSPLSTARFLPPQGTPFDLVVFDEASQITPADAIGALARAKQAIVVGDSKQLPPTAFFEPGEGEDDDARGEETSRDLESLLDEMVAARTPSLMLRWHYRSRDEALIAFSNDRYYAGRLLTFPGPGGGGDLGVSLRRTAGVFERSGARINRAEAEAVAAEVVARLTDPARRSRSIGVVTFNRPQQLLIEDLLDAAREAHPEIEPYFTDAAPEPVFVKNLENVQGDERDVMLFSIAYGPDAAGRTTMNFGPLNRQGGERRLNVAVTRARERLIVFTSMPRDAIDLSRTGALGAAHLKAFLRYAEDGPGVLAETSAVIGGTTVGAFESEIAEALRARGRAVETGVGRSDYRVDAAVRAAAPPHRCVLGVETDGKAWRSGATVRDRERLRRAALEGLGWRTTRVWSADWRADREGVLRRLEREIAEAEAAPERPAPPGANASVAPGAVSARAEPAPALEVRAAGDSAPAARVAAAPASASAAKPRPPAGGDPEAFYAPSETQRLADAYAAAALAEAPVRRESVGRRVAAAWGLTAAGAKAKRRLEEIADVVVRRGALVERGAFLWAPGVDPEAWDAVRPPAPGEEPRDVDEVPTEELAAAMRRTLAASVAMAEDDLFRAAASALGWRRLTPRVRDACAAALAWCEARGRAKRTPGGAIALP